MFRFHDFFRNHKTLLIAEFANAHEGRIEDALKMIDVAVSAGADALKFQMFFADELLVPEHPKYSVFKQLEMSRTDWYTLMEAADSSEKLVFIDIFGEESYRFSRNFSVDAFKIHASDMTNLFLLDKVSSSGISLILSAGACTMEELERAVACCNHNAAGDFAIMHGFQNYPTRVEDTHLNLISTLEQKFSCPVGYADHIDGGSEMAVILPLLAVAKGSKIIEKHFTLDRDLQGIDYQSSVNPDILAKIIRLVHDSEPAFGSTQKRLSADEEQYKKDVRKRLVVTRDMRAGEVLTTGDITFKRADQGLFAEDLQRVTGKPLGKDILKNHVITDSHVGLKK